MSLLKLYMKIDFNNTICFVLKNLDIILKFSINTLLTFLKYKKLPLWLIEEIKNISHKIL